MAFDFLSSPRMRRGKWRSAWRCCEIWEWKDGTFKIHSGGLFFCFQDKRMMAFLGIRLGICLEEQNRTTGGGSFGWFRLAVEPPNFDRYVFFQFGIFVRKSWLRSVKMVLMIRIITPLYKGFFPQLPPL